MEVMLTKKVILRPERVCEGFNQNGTLTILKREDEIIGCLCVRWHDKHLHLGVTPPDNDESTRKIIEAVCLGADGVAEGILQIVYDPASETTRKQYEVTSGRGQG